MIQGAQNAQCPRHPDQAATATCNRCGRFVCTTCLNVEASQTLCDECYQRKHSGKASGRAVGALVLGLVGLNCMPFLGILAIIMANAELAAIERGESPSKGANLAKGARILGWIEVGLMGMGAVAVVVMAIAFGSELWSGFARALDDSR